jgi:MFS transporter, PAT family, beta-lactamase induction signal transducer AmpG
LPPSSQRSRASILSVAAILYFSEGFPYGIVTELAPLYLRLQHVDLKAIGLASAVGLAWTLKFLWSPLVDTFGTYRRWIAGSLIAISAALAGIASFAGHITYAFYALLAVVTIASATQDIAVDAFTIRTTPQDLLGPVNSVRVTAYRIALMLGGGGLAALGGIAGWRVAFGAAALVSLIILAFTWRLPDDRGERKERANLLKDLAHWLRRPNSGWLLAVVFLYRIGEFAVITMIKPYWVDRGYSAAEIGTITSVIGVIVSIVGVMLGGFVVAKLGIYRGLIILGIAQVISNLGYALVATTNAGRWAIYAAAISENLGYGAGVAAFLAFLMAICDRERAATEYALLTAVFGLTGRLVGMASGYVAEAFGYAGYFWITVALGIPVLFLLPFIRTSIPTEPAKA